MPSMHLPERQLRAYLDTFVPPAERERILDRVAEHALETGDAGELALLAVAHAELPPDRRRTPAVEAAVLCGELDLTEREAAKVLGVTVAVLRGEAPEGSEGSAGSGDAAPEPERRRSRWLALVGTIAGLGAAGWLGVVVFSGGGRAQLSQQGLDPGIALPVAIGFVVGGVALLVAASRRR